MVYERVALLACAACDANSVLKIGLMAAGSSCAAATPIERRMTAKIGTDFILLFLAFGRPSDKSSSAEFTCMKC